MLKPEAQDNLVKPEAQNNQVELEAQCLPQTNPPVDYTGVWLRNRGIERYNEYLADFTVMVEKNLDMIEAQITATKEAQASRYMVGRVASRGGDEDAKGVELRERITKLKATGWRRERFHASRYEQLCELALGEL